MNDAAAVPLGAFKSLIANAKSIGEQGQFVSLLG